MLCFTHAGYVVISKKVMGIWNLERTSQTKTRKIEGQMTYPLLDKTDLLDQKQEKCNQQTESLQWLWLLQLLLQFQIPQCPAHTVEC